jgi:aminopeptidase N
MNNNIQLYDSFTRPDPDARRKLMANNLATAYASGSPRDAMKTYDRPGLSRGRAQENQAGIDSARQMAEGVRDAYAQDDQIAAAEATGNLRQATAQEQYANQLSALQQQEAYARQMAMLNARQQSLNFATGLLGGLLR